MKYKLITAKIFRVLIIIAAASFFAEAQSTLVDYPTGVSTNVISGKIPARDLGDGRLTSYYYTFNGTQGDIFVNVAASNFNGDIDVFVADGLRPLTKITFYADGSAGETGRVIYLRKPEKLLLRVQGRTPDDDPATFTIKFAGSFVAVQNGDENENLKPPEVTSENAGTVRVNSVGTIIKTENVDEVKETVAKTEVINGSEVQAASDPPPAAAVTDNKEPVNKNESDNVAETKSEPENVPSVKTARRRTPPRTSRNRARANTSSAAKNTTAATKAKKAEKSTVTEPTTEVAVAKVNPLENVNLIVLMKNGDKMEFPMTTVFRFSMNNGVLTIITKDGKVHRKSILDVQKMTVE